MDGQEADFPLVTVIMPIRNEGSFIRRSLGAVLDQDYPPDRLQILIVDGGSTDSTREIVQELQANYHNIELIDNPQKIVPTGMNAAIARAQGTIIVRVDGHTIVTRDYVHACVVELLRTGADNVGGRMVAVSENLFGRAVAVATSSPFGVGGSRFHYSLKEEWVDSVYMGAWRKSVFDQIGLFDEEMVRNQDDELNYRLRGKGGRILLSPSIRSTYYNRATPHSLARQYYQYGFWKVRVLQKHPRQMSLRHYVPSAFVLAICVAIGIAAMIPWFDLVLLCGCLFYCLLGVLFANRSSPGLPLLQLVLTVPAFGIIHLSYGAGFLVGLVRYLDRWRR